MSIWSYFKGSKRLEGIDEGETTVFMIPQRGWFWYIPLPDDQVSVGVVAAECVSDALAADDLSGDRLGAFSARLMGGVEVIYRLIFAFYDPAFSFGSFVKRFPNQRAALIDCLVGDVVGKDMSPFLEALERAVA
jgi:hypothetical protein